MSSQLALYFLTDQERLCFRTLTLLLQHTNNLESGNEGRAQEKKGRKHCRCQAKYDMIYTHIQAFARLLARGDETIAVHISKSFKRLRVAVSTPTGPVPREQSDDGSEDERLCFEEHCFRVHKYLKDLHDCPLSCLKKREMREPCNTFTHTQYRCFREPCNRCELRLELQRYIIGSSHVLMRQRLDFGKLCHGRNIFWTLTRPVREIALMAGAADLCKYINCGMDAFFRLRMCQLDRFISGYPGLCMHWRTEAPVDMLRGLDKTNGNDRKYEPIFCFSLMFHCVLRFILLELDEGLRLRHTKQTLRAISALDILRIAFVVDLQAELTWLSALHSYTDAISFPSSPVAKRSYTAPDLRQPPSPPPSHPLYPESSALDSPSCQDPWCIAAISYIWLLLSHEIAMDILTTPRYESPIAYILRTVRIEPISYTPAPRLAGHVLPPVEAIRKLRLSERLQESLLAHIEGLSLFTDNGNTATTTSTTTTTIFCHAEMQIAALHHLGKQWRPLRKIAHDKNKKNMKDNPAVLPLAVLHEACMLRWGLCTLGTAQATCVACQKALEISHAGGWRVPVPRKEDWWQACDMPGWMPRWVGEIMIKEAEDALRERAQRLWERARDLDMEFDKELGWDGGGLGQGEEAGIISESDSEEEGEGEDVNISADEGMDVDGE
ncbi:hypothetical protein F4809DRAFT_637306 [Biscogniauxia mediterranea]|nr:hypothetical protein F4809DRAFT_637306 [Biscogniauxia mediterranea]